MEASMGSSSEGEVGRKNVRRDFAWQMYAEWTPGRCVMCDATIYFKRKGGKRRVCSDDCAKERQATYWRYYYAAVRKTDARYRAWLAEYRKTK